MANSPPILQEPDSRLNVTFDDLQDKNAYRLNQVINHLYSKFDSLANNGRFNGTSQFQNIVINADRNIADLQNPQVLNYGELKKLGLAGGTVTNIFGGGGGGGGGTTTTRVQYAPQIPYTDSITRFLGEKVGERISVLDFGAVGDGVTDDQPAFQDAIDSAIAAGGKTIYIPACRFGSFYKIDSKITINNALVLTGTVNVTGADVEFSSGYKFPSYIVSQTITINAIDYVVDTWVDDENITLTTAGIDGSSLSYSTPGQGFVPLVFIGEGDSSVVLRGDTLGAREGLFDIQGEDILFSRFKVDGNVTTPTGILYATFSSDPMNALLTVNTSFWIHGPSANISFEYLTITHTGGYAILLDAANSSNQYDANSYDVNNIRVLYCNFLNNRPNLFGVTPGQENYGSWTGGIFLNTYGVQSGSNYLSTVQGFLAEGNYFEGNTGNCIWSHLYGFDQFIYDFRCLGNTFIDNGLDCIEPGGISGGAVIGNRTRRTGYIATDTTQDVSISNPTIPKWLANVNATAIDSSGVCRNMTYANNTCISTNGGDFDLDGFSTGDFTGNVSMTPEAGTPEYIQDSIAISGPANDGVTWSYGCQPSNTFGGDYGATQINITGNSFLNKNGGAIRLGASRNCFVSNNNIWHPPDANFAPIIMFNIGAADNQRTFDTAVLNNLIHYDPVSMVSSIQEVVIGGNNFVAGDKNWVHGNTIIGNSYEFYKDPNTDSTSGITISSSYNQLAIRSNSLQDRYRTVVTGKNFDYLQFSSTVSSTTTQAATLSDNAIIGIGGYVNTSGAAVDWVSGNDFSTFAAAGSIVINAVTYTILTVNSTISITLTTSAGSQSAVVFTNPIYHQGSPVLNVGDASFGSVTTGARFILGFDDVIATGSAFLDGFLSVTDATFNTQYANKLPDTYGLLRYDSVAKVFKVSTSATAGVRSWTTLGTGGSVAGSNTYVQYNDSGAFGADANFTWDKTTKVLTIIGTTATASIVAATSFIQAQEGFYTTSLQYNAIQAPSGGMLADSFTAINYIQSGNSAGPPTPTSGDSFQKGALYYDTGSNSEQVWDGSAWISLGGGTGTPGGSNTYVQFNNAGSFGGVSDFTWTSGSKLLTITGTSSTAGIAVANAYIQSDGGFLVPNINTAPYNSSDVIQAKAGGVTALSLISIRNDGNSGVTISRASATARTYGLGVSSSGKLQINDDTASAVRAEIDTVGTWSWSNNFFLDQSGNVVFVGVIAGSGASAGINLSSATATNSIQTTGGVTAKYLISTTSYTQTGDTSANAGLSSSVAPGSGRIYFDSTSRKFRASENGGAYVDLVGGGSTPGGSNTYVQYNNASAYGGDADFVWAKSPAKQLTITGVTGTAGIVAANCFMQSAQGFLTTSTSYQGIQSPSGGVYGSSFKAINYAHPGSRTTDPTATSGDTITDGTMYYNSSTSRLKVRISSTFVDIITTAAYVSSITGTTSQVIASASTGAVTLSLPQNIDTSATPTFNRLTLTGTSTLNLSGIGGSIIQNGTTRLSSLGIFTGVSFSASSLGAGNSFSNSNGTFSVSTTGDINGSGQINMSGAYLRGGATIINTSNQWVGGQVLANGNIQTINGVYSVSVTSGPLTGAYFGSDATTGLVCGARTLYFKSGILYAFS